MLLPAGDHPNFRKNALGVKRPLSELSESSGVFLEQLSEFRVRHSILGMASHDLSNTKTTILGTTPGAIPGTDGNRHEIRKIREPIKIKLALPPPPPQNPKLPPP